MCKKSLAVLCSMCFVLVFGVGLVFACDDPPCGDYSPPSPPSRCDTCSEFNSWIDGGAGIYVADDPYDPSFVLSGGFNFEGGYNVNTDKPNFEGINDGSGSVNGYYDEHCGDFTMGVNVQSQHYIKTQNWK